MKTFCKLIAIGIIAALLAIPAKADHRRDHNPLDWGEKVGLAVSVVVALYILIDHDMRRRQRDSESTGGSPNTATDYELHCPADGTRVRIICW